MRDYVNKLEDFVEEAEHIRDKVDFDGGYGQMRFDDVHHYYHEPATKYTKKFDYHPNLYHKLESEITGDRLEEVTSRTDRFKRFVSSFDEYKPNNLRMFEACTEEIINEAVMKLAKELDNGSGEFVDLVFRSEF